MKEGVGQSQQGGINRLEAPRGIQEPQGPWTKRLGRLVISETAPPLSPSWQDTPLPSQGANPFSPLREELGSLDREVMCAYVCMSTVIQTRTQFPWLTQRDWFAPGIRTGKYCKGPVHPTCPQYLGHFVSYALQGLTGLGYLPP